MPPRRSTPNGKKKATAVSFHHYRATTIGQELDEAIDDCVQAGLFDGGEKEAILAHFDRVFPEALATSNMTFKAKARVGHYRSFDDVWMFMLNSVHVEVNGSKLSSDERTKILSAVHR